MRGLCQGTRWRKATHHPESKTTEHTHSRDLHTKMSIFLWKSVGMAASVTLSLWQKMQNFSFIEKYLLRKWSFSFSFNHPQTCSLYLWVFCFVLLLWCFAFHTKEFTYMVPLLLKHITKWTILWDYTTYYNQEKKQFVSGLWVNSL